ncbi:RDD family protein [Bdellovibrio sp. ArHS]|uniref:RDD family protein n=1 Tax=Bdellovibrio sp. ArHS TaxID=1569284 RepID=UPI000AED6F3B|nr:RDD family protein [Bdellovibrio sp. ArHS]
MDSVYVPSTIRRLIAHAIDQVVRLIFYIPFLKPFFLLIFTDDQVPVSFFTLALLFLIPAIYEFIFLVVMQATPGKWFMGLKVVPFSNPKEALDWRQCVLRPLTERLTFFFSWALYALAFFRYDRTHLADWVAETRVVQFKPRVTRAQIRWITGSLLVFLYVYEGLVSSAAVLRVMDWQNKRVDLRDIVATEYMEDMTDYMPEPEE